MVFSDIIAIKEQLKQEDRIRQYIGVFIGKVCYYRVEDKAVRVVQVNDPSNYVTWWLKPSSGASSRTVAIGDFVIFCFPTLDPKNGVYLDLFGKVFDSGEVTPEYVLDQIELAIDEYDDVIKAYIASLNYTTLSAVQSWVLAQNYTTLTAVASYIAAQNFVTATSLASTLTNYVTNSSLTSTLANYVTNSSLTTTLANYVTTTVYNNGIAARKQSVVNSFRYIQSLSAPNGGGDFAALDTWINKVVTLMVTGVANRTPPMIGTSPTPIDHSNAKYRIVFNSTVNGNTATGDEWYFRVDSQYRHYVIGNGSTLVNGSAVTEYAMNPRECWKVTKTGANTFSMTNTGDFYFNPY